LNDVDAVFVVDCQQDVMRLDRPVVDDDRAMPRPPDDVPARL
jgi:hypothetical protein